MRKKAKRGFSLIEVIISVALLAILLIPISNVIIGTTKKNKDAEIKNKVTTEAQKVLEELNSYDTLTFDSATNNFTMLNGQMILHYDSVHDTISTVNPGTVTNNNDEITISVSGVKSSDLARATSTAASSTATGTATATPTAAAPDLIIRSDGTAKAVIGSETSIANVDEGLIFLIADDYRCAVFDNNSGSPGAVIGVIPENASHTYTINLEKGATDNGRSVPIYVYCTAQNEVNFNVNYQYGLSDTTRLNIVNELILANVVSSYNYLPSTNPNDAFQLSEPYMFTVTAQAKSPLSKELDSSGNKVNKVLKFEGNTLKNVVFK